MAPIGTVCADILHSHTYYKLDIASATSHPHRQICHLRQARRAGQIAGKFTFVIGYMARFGAFVDILCVHSPALYVNTLRIFADFLAWPASREWSAVRSPAATFPSQQAASCGGSMMSEKSTRFGPGAMSSRMCSLGKP